MAGLAVVQLHRGHGVLYGSDFAYGLGCRDSALVGRVYGLGFGYKGHTEFCVALMVVLWGSGWFGSGVWGPVG